MKRLFDCGYILAGSLKVVLTALVTETSCSYWVDYSTVYFRANVVWDEHDIFAGLIFTFLHSDVTLSVSLSVWIATSFSMLSSFFLLNSA